MASPDTGDPSRGRWRVVVLAVTFALLSHGCFMLATSLTVNPL